MKTIYYNGIIKDIYTESTYDNILVEDNIIKEMNTTKKADKYYDLKGNLMLTSFIDSHSHLSSLANSFLQVNLENAKNYNDIINSINDFIELNKPSDDEFIICNMLDHSNLEENKLPNCIVLDVIKYPIVISHQNGHCGCFNTKAMEILNINSSDGILQEQQYMTYIQKVKMPSFEKLLNAYVLAQKYYLKYGITTIQEGIVVKQMIPIYKMLQENNLLFLDVVCYPDLSCYDEFKNTFYKSYKKYNNHLKIGGIKIILDGSPQTKTAWMNEKYLDGTNGYQVLSDEEVKKAIQKAIDEDIQIIAHCNGSKAISQYINCLDTFDKNKIRSIRPVIIHSQFLPVELLDKVKEMNIIPSFFIGHVYYFADEHIKNLGICQTKKMSITKSTLNKNILFTFHQDTPVTKPNYFESIDISMKRITKNGIKLSGEEISFKDAFIASTYNGAYSYFEEDTKGNIAINKKAQFIVIDSDSLNDEVSNYKIIDVIY